MTMYLDVALPVPLRDTFTYAYEGDPEDPQIGARVSVTFGGRTLTGVIIAVTETTTFDSSKIKPITQLLDREPVLPDELLQLCHWGAQYYLHPLGEVINSALPQRYRDGKPPAAKTIYAHTSEGLGLPDTALKGATRQQEIHQYLLTHQYLSREEFNMLGLSKAALKTLTEKGLVEKKEANIAANTLDIEATTPLLNEPHKVLNAEQQAVFDQIRCHHYSCLLLYGATGSGKTEIYLQVIARVLQSGKQALVLIPEIGLTPQTISRFRNRFSISIAELHSNIAEGERASAWERAKSGEARIVIGTRLASLTPFKNLGVIVVDEEHDRSYKQQDGFKYSARDISIFRAHNLSIPIILGSATPSLESLHNAKKNKYMTLVLKERAGGASKPRICTIDLKNKETQHGLTLEAVDELRNTLARGQQAIVFVNRRGYAPSLICHSCGWTAECKACDARMTVHSTPYHLRCHSCDRSRKAPSRCPSCGGLQLNTFGLGTEQIEQGLTALFPDTPIMRIDRDSTRKKGSFQDKLVRNDQPCVFVGTQMLAKGHHLPNLTLVVIVDADQGLLSPDFRGIEQMGQLIIQISGRAGRASHPGRVVVQSHRPDHPLLQKLLKSGYDNFAQNILAQRHDANLPPYWYTVFIRAESKRSDNSLNFLAQARAIISRRVVNYSGVQVLGPHPSAIEKVNNRFRYTLQLKCPSRKTLQQCLKEALQDIDQLALAKRTRWSIEVDSLSPA